MSMNLKVFLNFGKNYLLNVFLLIIECMFFFPLISIFNTNNLWINLPAVKRIIEDKTLHMEIIVNYKVLYYLKN